MHWEDYETTVKHIYETLGKEHGVKIICYGRKCKCTGKNSGVPHQLDVLYSTTDGINIYKSYVECKYRNEKINKDHIMKVEAIIKDCHLNKGIIVSKLGFKDQAINYAKSVNIELQILREPTEKDKKDRLWEIMLRPSLVTSVYINVNIITEDGMDPTNVERLKLYCQMNRSSI